MPDWPRLMPRRLAAAYLGVSASTFDRKFKHISPLPNLGGNKAWDRQDLDAAIDQCKKGVYPNELENEWNEICDEGSLQICAGHQT